MHIPERDFDLMGRRITRERFATERREVPKANWWDTLDFPKATLEQLIFRMTSYLNLVNLVFTERTEYEDGMEETDPLSSETIEFCQASGQRALEFSLEYALAHEINVPASLMFNAKTAIETYRPTAERFYARGK